MPDEGRQATKYQSTKRWFLIVWGIVGVGLIVYALGFILEVLSLPVATIVIAAIIVFLLRNIVSFFEARRVPRLFGTIIAYVIMFAVLAVIALLLFSPVFGFGEQLMNLFQNAPVYVEQISTWISGLYDDYSHIFNNDMVRQWFDQVFASLSSWASDVARSSAAGVVTLSAVVVNGALAIFFAFVIAFWVLMELPAIGRELNRLIPDKYREDADLLHVTLTRVMGGYLKATVLQCLLIGLGTGILFMVLGIPNFAALGLITGILNILPIIGPWVGGALAAIVGLMMNPVSAIIALVGTIIIQQFVTTFVSPKIMQNSVDVHPALVLVVLMIGAAIGTAMAGLGGALVGMFFAIPAVAVIKSMFVYYFERATHRRIVAEDGVFFKGAPASDDEVDPIADAIAPHPDATVAFKLPDMMATSRIPRDEIQRRQAEIDARKAAPQAASRPARPDSRASRPEFRAGQHGASEAASKDSLRRLPDPARNPAERNGTHRKD